MGHIRGGSRRGSSGPFTPCRPRPTRFATRSPRSTLRAYSPELTGWFDDFGQSGKTDAFGPIGRIAVGLNEFSASVPGLPCPSQLDAIGGLCKVLNPGQLLASLGIKNLQRCPGANERGLTDEQLTQGGTIDCNPNQTPLGP